MAWQGGPRRPFVPTSPAGRPNPYASSSSAAMAVCCGPVLVWFPKSQEKLSRFVLHWQGAARRWQSGGTARFVDIVSRCLNLFQPEQP